MLHGETVLLRELRRADVEVLHGAFQTDPAMHAVVSETPWRPSSVEHRLAELDRRLAGPQDEGTVSFAVQRRDDPNDRCLGSCLLWGIDTHNRTAHLGVTLVAAARGRGLGREIVNLLCEYAFVHRDLHRVQLETLESNSAMSQVALACGFMQEGRRREAAFVTGARSDEVIYGLLATEWRARRAEAEQS
jgi:RimJ/RimL family protein N-acetyltransferase